MGKLFQFKTVLVYDASLNYLGTVRASLLKAEAVDGCIDEIDLQESINLLRHSKTRELVLYENANGGPYRFYRLGVRRRVVVGSDL